MFIGKQAVTVLLNRYTSVFAWLTSHFTRLRARVVIARQPELRIRIRPLGSSRHAVVFINAEFPELMIPRHEPSETEIEHMPAKLHELYDANTRPTLRHIVANRGYTRIDGCRRFYLSANDAWNNALSSMVRAWIIRNTPPDFVNRVSKRRFNRL